MKIWVLEKGIDYEGRDLLGVFSTVELAREAASKYVNDKSSFFDTVHVTESDLDTILEKPAEWSSRDGKNWKRWM